MHHFVPYKLAYSGGSFAMESHHVPGAAATGDAHHHSGHPPNIGPGWPSPCSVERQTLYPAKGERYPRAIRWHRSPTT